MVLAGCSSINRWIQWYTQCGLESMTRGRVATLPYRQIKAVLEALIQISPQDIGYQRSRWSTELVAIEINRIPGLSVHASTIRPWLPRMGIAWRRAAPTLHIRDPDWDAKLAREKQKEVAMPGHSAKHYLAGALHAKTGRVSYVASSSKDSNLFLSMLQQFKHQYQKTKTSRLSWTITSSTRVRKHCVGWPETQSSFCCSSQFTHLGSTSSKSSGMRHMKRVRHFMDNASPYPGGDHGLIKVEHN